MITFIDSLLNKFGYKKIEAPKSKKKSVKSTKLVIKKKKNVRKSK